MLPVTTVYNYQTLNGVLFGTQHEICVLLLHPLPACRDQSSPPQLPLKKCFKKTCKHISSEGKHGAILTNSPNAPPRRTRRPSPSRSRRNVHRRGAIPHPLWFRPRMARSAASLPSCAFTMAGSAGVVVDPRSSRSAL
jgi:hypothetical protein